SDVQDGLLVIGTLVVGAGKEIQSVGVMRRIGGRLHSKEAVVIGQTFCQCLRVDAGRFLHGEGTVVPERTYGIGNSLRPDGVSHGTGHDTILVFIDVERKAVPSSWERQSLLAVLKNEFYHLRKRRPAYTREIGVDLERLVENRYRTVAFDQLQVVKSSQGVHLGSPRLLLSLGSIGGSGRDPIEENVTLTDTRIEVRPGASVLRNSGVIGGCHVTAIPGSIGRAGHVVVGILRLVRKRGAVHIGIWHVAVAGAHPTPDPVVIIEHIVHGNPAVGWQFQGIVTGPEKPGRN